VTVGLPKSLRNHCRVTVNKYLFTRPFVSSHFEMAKDTLG